MTDSIQVKTTKTNWLINRVGFVWHNFVKWVLLGLLLTTAILLANIIMFAIILAYSKRSWFITPAKWLFWTYIRLPIKQYRYGRMKWKENEANKRFGEFSQ